MTHGGPDYSLSTIAGGGGAIIQPQKPYFNRDVVNRVLGDVVVFDPTTTRGAKACTTLSDPRVLGVVNDSTIPPGVEENLLYHGQGYVNVIGTGSAGNALVTSATSGAAQANGGITNQPGFVGTALESWAGPGLILADIDCQTLLWGGEVKFEGTIEAIGNGAAVNLQCGANLFRYVLAVAVATNDIAQGNFGTAPRVNGVLMTAVGAQLTTFGDPAGGVWYEAQFFFLNAPPSGLVGVTGAIEAIGGTIGCTTFFIALSGVNQASAIGTVVKSVILASAAPAIQTTDAVAGDLVVGFLGISDTTGVTPNVGYITGIGAGQTSRLRDAPAAPIKKVLQDLETKTASVVAETIGWTLNAVHNGAYIVVPVHPA